MRSPDRKISLASYLCQCPTCVNVPVDADPTKTIVVSVFVSVYHRVDDLVAHRDI